jgi:excisionase family DNA binding protein
MAEQVLLSSITPSELTKLITEGVKDQIEKMMSLKHGPEAIKYENEHYSVKEACQFLKCSTAKLWRLRKDGIIPYTKCGRTVLIAKSDLIKLIQESKKKGGQND